jgi:hypothetical protein
MNANRRSIFPARSSAAASCLVCLLGLAPFGCQAPVHFPLGTLAEAARQAGAVGAYDTDGDGKADFFTFADSAGRINRIAHSCGASGKCDSIVDLDAVPVANCRHLVIILDGFGYDVVKRYYDEGGLRFFHAPSRVVAPYPTLTDSCLEDALGYIPCRSLEALYYDRRLGQVVGGSGAYLEGRNQPYERLLQYRAGYIWDAIGYVYPWQVFGKEINDLKRTFDQTMTREVIAYVVSSAGVGTQKGAEGQRQCLQKVDQLINQVVWETRGLVKLTMFADHGHSYTPSKRILLEDHLTAKGWRIVDRLQKPKDVAYIRFGLETYASFATDQPAELAGDLIAHPGVIVASYAQKDAVVVLAGYGHPKESAGRTISSALIRRKNGRYKYEPIKGDPLKYTEALARLPADAEGYYEPDAMLAATIEHDYPAALERLWRAHFGLVENPPDVIISLDNQYFSGSAAFGGAVTVASTHGSLDRSNSTTFIMSTAGALPPFMRSADIPRNMEKVLGTTFPMRR